MKQCSLFFLFTSVYFGSHQAYSAATLLVKRAERTGARPSGWRASMQALKRINFFCVQGTTRLCPRVLTGHAINSFVFSFFPFLEGVKSSSV
jgi:hypothetical protein